MSKPEAQTNRRRYSLFAKSLQSCVEPLVRPVLKKQGLAGSKIVTEWPQIMGALATHCSPEKLSFPQGKKTGGTLTIACESGYALELQHMTPMLLERFAMYFGYKAIAHISINQCFVAPVAAPVKAKTQPSKHDYRVGDIADDELKAALESLAATLAGRTSS